MKKASFVIVSVLLISLLFIPLVMASYSLKPIPEFKPQKTILHIDILSPEQHINLTNSTFSLVFNLSTRPRGDLSVDRCWANITSTIINTTLFNKSNANYTIINRTPSTYNWSYEINSSVDGNYTWVMFCEYNNTILETKSGSFNYSAPIVEKEVEEEQETTSSNNDDYVPVVEKCTENWDCSSWSGCNGDFQSRTCIELNNCGNENKPVTRMMCEEENFNIAKVGLSIAPPLEEEIEEEIENNLITGAVTGDGTESKNGLIWVLITTGVLVAVAGGLTIYTRPKK